MAREEVWKKAMTSRNKKTLREKLADSHYQPTKAELETEYDMPGAKMEEIRDAIFKPPQAGRAKLDQ